MKLITITYNATFEASKSVYAQIPDGVDQAEFLATYKPHLYVEGMNELSHEVSKVGLVFDTAEKYPHLPSGAEVWAAFNHDGPIVIQGVISGCESRWKSMDETFKFNIRTKGGTYAVSPNSIFLTKEEALKKWQKLAFGPLKTKDAFDMAAKAMGYIKISDIPNLLSEKP